MPATLSALGIKALVGLLILLIFLGGVTAFSSQYFQENIGAGAIKDKWLALYAVCRRHVKTGAFPFPNIFDDNVLIASWKCTFETTYFPSAGFFFLCLFLLKYVRLVGNAIAFWSITPVRPPLFPTFLSEDVTVVIPTTMENQRELMDCMESIRENNPAQIILVTKESKRTAAHLLCKQFGLNRVKILGVPELSKRLQLIEGLKWVETPMTAFADDDVIWGPEHLTCLLACMENSKIGAVGSGMRCIRQSNPDIWNFLGIAYLERRNFNTGSTNHIDGGISTLSGRTALYRTDILQNEGFYNAFKADSWNGRVLNTDDDKFLTKWLFARGWKIHLQFAEEVTLYTSLGMTAPKFLSQCIRWARAHWRGNIRVVSSQSYWYKSHPWTCYATYFGSLLTPSFAVDGLLLYLLHKWMISSGVDSASHTAGMIVLGIWIGLTKVIKLLPHFYRFPEDIKFIPASIIFGYLHGFINIYALLTMDNTNWGSRAAVDRPTARVT